MLHPVPLKNSILVIILAALISSLACGGGGAASIGGGTTIPITPGSPALSLSPVAVEFAEQPIATPSSAQNVLVKNTGTANLSIGSIGVTGDFSESHDCGTSLAPNGSCTVSVTFSPSATGTRTGELNIVDSSATTKYAVTVRGKGVTKAQLTADVTSLAFGSVVIGQSSSKTVTLKNTGGQSLKISGVSTSVSAFSASSAPTPVTLTPGASTTVSVSFSPTTNGTINGTLYLANSTSSQPYAISLSGTGTTQATGQLTASATSLNFGNVTVGQSSAQTVTLSNTGTASLTVSGLSVTGNGYSLSAPATPFTLAPGASSIATVTFKPAVAGNASGNIAVSSSVNTQPLAISLAGNAVNPAQLTASVTSLNFGTVTIGQSSKQTLSLSNTGGTSLTVSSLSISVAGYTVDGATLPLTIAPGASVTLTVTFVPTTSGTVSGSLSISNSGNTQPLGIALTGIGASPAQLSASTTNLSFGTAVVGQSSNQTVRLTNTGGTTLTVSAVAVTGTGFAVSGLTTPLTLAPGAISDMSVSFKPTAAGNVSGNVAITNSASTQPLTLSLSGNGALPAQLVASASSVTFGSVAIGDTSSQTLTLSNTGGVSLTISAVTATGTGFSVSGLTTPFTLVGGAKTTLSVSFKPSATGSSTGSIAIGNSGATQSLTVALAGTGVTAGKLVPNTTSVNFGTINVGQSGSQTLTLSNTGGSTVTVSSLSTSGPGFAINGVTLPFTLAAGGSKNVGITFSPSNSGTASGNVYISSSNPQSITIALSGSAVDVPAPVTHSVTISWNPSTSTTSGYYVYRATQSGGPYIKINSSLETATLYTDDTVQNGKAYYYVVTTLDQKSVESNYSSEVVANVPAS